MSVDTLNSASHVRTLLMLAIVLEAHRYLSDYWLLRARDVDHSADRVPLLDIMHWPTSVLIVSLQYLSSLLFSCGAGRLKLLWMYQQFESFEEFCASMPGQIREFRRLTLVTFVGIAKFGACAGL